MRGFISSTANGRPFPNVRTSTSSLPDDENLQSIEKKKKKNGKQSKNIFYTFVDNKKTLHSGNLSLSLSIYFYLLVIKLNIFYLQIPG